MTQHLTSEQFYRGTKQLTLDLIERYANRPSKSYKRGHDVLLALTSVARALEELNDALAVDRPPKCSASEAMERVAVERTNNPIYFSNVGFDGVTQTAAKLPLRIVDDTEAVRRMTH